MVLAQESPGQIVMASALDRFITEIRASEIVVDMRDRQQAMQYRGAKPAIF